MWCLVKHFILTKVNYSRHQANSLPDVSRADIDLSKFEGRQTQYMPVVEGVDSCPSSSLPNHEWESDILFDFSELRGLLARLSMIEKSKERRVSVPPLRDVVSWVLFCFNDSLHLDLTVHTHVDKLDGDVDDKDDEEAMLKKRKIEVKQMFESVLSLDEASVGVESGSMSETMLGEQELAHATRQDGNVDALSCQQKVTKWTGATNVPPSTSLLLQFDQVMTQRLIEHHVNWLDST